MRYLIVAVLLMSGMLGAVAPGWAGDAAFSREVQTFFDRVATAFDQKNLAGVVATAVPGATIKPLAGQPLTVEEWKAAAQPGMDNTATMRSRFQVDRAAAFGDGGTAEYTETHDFTLLSDPGHQYRMVSSWRVILGRAPDGLRARHFVQLTGSSWRDGKPFAPQAAKR